MAGALTRSSSRLAMRCLPSLGLALAREIAEAHSGRLQLANRAEGGLVVTLSLPQPEPPAAD